jgi:hypothetical protein
MLKIRGMSMVDSLLGVMVHPAEYLFSLGSRPLSEVERME